VEAIVVDEALEKLEMFINKQAEQEITKEEVQRVIAPALEKIKAREPRSLKHIKDKKILLAYMSELLAAETSNGKLIIVMIDDKAETSNNRSISYRGEY